MAVTTGELSIGVTMFAADSAAADIEEWNVEGASTMVEIVSITVGCENIIPSTFSVQGDDNVHFLNAAAVSRGGGIKMGPYPNGARPRLMGLSLDTPTFGTGPVSYCVVYKRV